MSDDLITIRLRLTGGTAAAAEAKAVSAEVSTMGRTTAVAGKSASLASRGIGKFRTGIVALGKAAKYVAFGGIAALGIETVRSINAFRESRDVSRQTQAVIKSTGGAAKVTAKDVANLSGALSLKTGVDDEVIQSGANMLLTFKNIRNEAGKNNDIFNQSVESVNDLAAAMESTPKAAAIQLGKALNDPIAGMASLGRVGIQFTEAQKEQITGFVESNDLLSAQKLILGEVTTQFQGSARARSDAVDRLGVAFENLEEKLGKVLFPVITKVARFLTDFFTDIIQGKGIADDFGTAMGRLSGIFLVARAWVEGAVTSVKAFVDEVLHGSGSVGKFGQDLKAMGLAVKDFGIFLYKVGHSSVLQFFKGFRQQIEGLVKALGGMIKIVGGLLRGDWGRVWEGAKDVVSGVVNAMIGIAKTLIAPMRAAFNTIKAIVGGVTGWIGDRVHDVVEKIQDAVDLLDSIVPGGLAGRNISEVAADVEAANSADTSNTPHPSAPQSTGGPGPRNKLAQLAPSTRRRGGGGRTVIEHHSHIYLDGKEVAQNTTRHALAALARA